MNLSTSIQMNRCIKMDSYNIPARINRKLHYFPFGEELAAGTNTGDTIKKKNDVQADKTNRA